MGIEMKELLEKYEKAIEIGVVNKNDLISCNEVEMSIYKSIDIDHLLYMISCDMSLEEVLRKHLSLSNVRESISSSAVGKERFLKDICMIIELSNLDVCIEYPLLLADLFEVAESQQSLSSTFHDIHMQSLATNILSSDYGSLKEAKSYALKEAILHGNVDSFEDDCSKKIYPTTHLRDILVILNAECEDACFALGRVVVEETLNKWDIRNQYMEEIAQCIDLDRIDILTDVAVSRNSINSDYYGVNLECLSSMDDIGVLDKLIATNPTSLDSAHHYYNMRALSWMRGVDDRDVLEILTSRDSLDSGSHMSNVEEYLERVSKSSSVNQPKMLIKANN